MGVEPFQASSAGLGSIEDKHKRNCGTGLPVALNPLRTKVVALVVGQEGQGVVNAVGLRGVE